MKLSENSWAERADTLDPKQELLRLPSKVDIVYAECVSLFDRYVREGHANEYSYPSLAEAVATNALINNWAIIAGQEEEDKVWQAAYIRLMSYAGRKFPNT